MIFYADCNDFIRFLIRLWNSWWLEVLSASWKRTFHHGYVSLRFSELRHSVLQQL